MRRPTAAPGVIVMRWAVCAALAAVLAGCSAPARKKLAGVLFDGADAPPSPPTRRLRRDLLQEIDSLKRQVAEQEAVTVAAASAAQTPISEATAPARRPIEAAKTWDEAAGALPKSADESGVDWDAALKQGVIAPQPGTAPGAAVQVTFPLDIEMVPASDPTYRVVFRHAPHTAWLSCENCHPAVFEPKRGANAVSMESIGQGRHCGVCHGKVAFTPDACARCHVSLSGSP